MDKTDVLEGFRYQVRFHFMEAYLVPKTNIDLSLHFLLHSPYTYQHKDHPRITRRSTPIDSG